MGGRTQLRPAASERGGAEGEGAPPFAGAIGAALWGGGIVYLGYALHFIPPVEQFVTHYIDVILIGAVLIAVIPTGLHLLNVSRKSKKLAAQQTENEN